MKITNILYIINELGHGGAEKQLMKLVDQLDKNKFNIHICCFKNSSSYVGNQKLNFILVKNRNILNPVFYKELFRLYSYCKLHNVQIIQTFFQDPTILGVFLKLLLKIKLIISFRDLGFWKTPIMKWKMMACYLFGDKFIANSRAVKEYYANADRVPENKIDIIYNGLQINKKCFIKQKKMNKGHYRVGLVANLNRPVKRVDDFIKAAKLVSNKMDNVIFQILGDGHLKKKLIDLCNQMGISDCIRFEGRVATPEKYISHFDVGLIISETEGLSNAILEYMAFGVPVIATNVGGNIELIKNNQNGYLVSVGNIEDMSSKIIKILNSPDLWLKMSLANKKKAMRNFALDKMIIKHERLYLNMR